MGANGAGHSGENDRPIPYDPTDPDEAEFLGIDEAPCERYKGVRPGPCVFCGHQPADHTEGR